MRQKEVFYVLFHSPYTSRARTGLGQSQESQLNLDIPLGGRDLLTWTFTCCLPGFTLEKTEIRIRAGTQTQALWCRLWASQAVSPLLNQTNGLPFSFWLWITLHVPQLFYSFTFWKNLDCFLLLVLFIMISSAYTLKFLCRHTFSNYFGKYRGWYC